VSILIEIIHQGQEFAVFVAVSDHFELTGRYLF